MNCSCLHTHAELGEEGLEKSILELRPVVHSSLVGRTPPAADTSHAALLQD